MRMHEGETVLFVVCHVKWQTAVSVMKQTRHISIFNP